MLIDFHILMTIISLVFAGYMSHRPVKTKLRITYIAVAFTIVSGILLVLENPSSLLQTVMSGTVYLAIVSLFTSIGENKLSHAGKLRKRGYSV